MACPKKQDDDALGSGRERQAIRERGGAGVCELNGTERSGSINVYPSAREREFVYLLIGAIRVRPS